MREHPVQFAAMREEGVGAGRCRVEDAEVRRRTRS
jgi:hypothetical protein